MLSRLGIETRLQLAMTLCVMALIIVTTLGGSGGAPWAFFTYRTLLLVIGVLRIQGSHFEGLYLWYKYAFFTCAFLGLARFTRYQSAKWKALFLTTIVAVDLWYLLPDLILRRPEVLGF